MVYGKRISWSVVQTNNPKFVEDRRKPLSGNARLKLEDPVRSMDATIVPVWFKHVCNKSLPDDEKFCFIGETVRIGRMKAPPTIRFERPGPAPKGPKTKPTDPRTDQQPERRNQDARPPAVEGDGVAMDEDAEDTKTAGPSRSKPLFLDEETETAASVSAGTPPPQRPARESPPPTEGAGGNGDEDSEPEELRWRSCLPSHVSRSVSPLPGSRNER